jgi:hypothetical protein
MKGRLTATAVTLRACEGIQFGVFSPFPEHDLKSLPQPAAGRFEIARTAWSLQPDFNLS